MAIDSKKDFKEHVQFTNNKQFWLDIRALIDADLNVVNSTKFLFPHNSELPANFTDTRDQELATEDRLRRERATQYKNELKFVRDRFVDLIMRGGLDTSSIASDVTEEELANIDGFKHSVNDFAGNLAEDSISYGVMYCQCDTQTMRINSLGDQVASKIRPYLIKLDNLSVRDWQINNLGQYDWITFEFYKLLDRESPLDDQFMARYVNVYRLQKIAMDDGTIKNQYVIDIYQSSNKEGLGVNYLAKDPEKEHTGWVRVNSIPVENVDFIPIATSLLQDSWLKDVKPLAIKLHNKESNLDNILYNQGYDKLFIFADLSNQTVESGKLMGESAKKLSISANTITVITDPNGRAEKITPTDPVALFNSINIDTINMFRIAFSLTRVIGSDSKVAQSAEAQQEAKEALFTKIENKRQEILDVLNESFANFIFYKDTSKPKKAVKLTFKKQLDELDYQTFIESITAFASRIIKYPTLQKEVDKQIVTKLNLEGNAEILAEINNTSDADVVATEADKAIKKQVGILTQ